MKKIFVLMLSSLILNNVWSQTEQKNIIKVNPFSLFLATGSAFYEHKIDEKHSWQVGIAYVGFTSLTIKYSGFNITPEYRIYFQKNAISGTYVGPFLRYQNYKITNEVNGTGRYTSFGGGVVYGHQWVYRKGFVMDAFAGPIYNAGKLSVITDAAIFNKPGFGIDGLGICAGLSLGFGF